MSSTIVAVKANVAQMAPEQRSAWRAQENELMGGVGEAQRDFFNAIREAGLFLDPTASSILDEGIDVAVPFESSDDETYDLQPIKRYMDQLSSWIGNMIEFGRRDLRGGNT